MSCFPDPRRMALFWSFCFSILLAGSVHGFSDDGPPFDKCGEDAYYASLVAEFGSNPRNWSADAVRALIVNTHRNSLPNVAERQNQADILTALRDLWPGTEEFTIRTVYRDVNFPTQRANTQLGWEREDLWPRYRGWDINNTDIYTDVHAKVPADHTVRTRKQSLFFGTCGTVEHIDECVTPATVETGPTTETDGKIFAPPDRYKGDVARALFYTAARYKESLGFELVDCPPFMPNEFGYLSELLKWHQNDPVSTQEEARNNKACKNWQGNRNPFVDHPELVLSVFYPDGPDQIRAGTFTYERCTAPTNSPTATPVACNDFEAGDVPLFLYNSLEPDQAVFFTLVDIPGSVGTLYLTDSAYNGTDFLNNEGTLEFEVPEAGIDAGQIFGFGDTSPQTERWTQLPDKGNAFDIQTAGDNLFLYCLDGDNLPVFLFGFSNNIWKDPGLSADEYGTDFSALPAPLALGGSLVVEGGENCVYSGPLDRNMTKEALQLEMIDPLNFDCINGTRFQLDDGTPIPSGGVMMMMTTTRTSMTTTVFLAMTLLTTVAAVFM